MSQSPRRQDSALDLETTSADELERVLVSRTPAENSQPDEVARPATRRCDSMHREILRQPFFFER